MASVRCLAHAEVLMSRVVPAAYISTDDAINELINSNPDWCRLSEVWESADGAAKHQAYGEVSALQDTLTQSLSAAVLANKLNAIALKQTANGEWTELCLPRDYWEGISGEVALFRGTVVGNGLSASDQWAAEAPLCFRRTEWDTWLSGRSTSRSGIGESRPPAGIVGRPPKWDWFGMAAEIVRIVNQPDGLPDSQADVEDQMAQWFVNTTGDQPAESQIREKVGRIFQRARAVEPGLKANRK
jgi:hypothetical protein